jgi:Domain of unknown function (DUF4082)/Bacterial Ig-like domain/Bacterial Ig domain/Secretion system C-terminal sorting domain
MSNTLTPYSKGLKNYAFLLLLSIFAFSSAISQNAIVTENALTGNPDTQWDLNTNSDGTFGDHSIAGFSTDISVNKGSTISFKVTITTGTDKQFGIKVYRLGYYQGNGARLIADLGSSFTGVAQAACNVDNVTGLTDCGNWTVNASWAVPSTVVSGIYIAKLTRSAAGGGGSSHIAFIVRDDASTSALLFKASDATWQAYNAYGGNSLYVGAGLANNHASKVSYNRPFITRDGGGGGGVMEDWLFNSEYPMIRFLERNGYDMSYITDVDVVRTPNTLLNHKVFMSVGHDEYWSKEERNGVEAARTAGKHLAFFSGNEIYWKTRWENSIDGSNTPLRTLVCYKEGTLPTPAENPCGGKCDPNVEWTGLWRDGCSFPTGNACKPENGLSGEISWDGTAGTITVPFAYKGLRFWRNTPTVSTLTSGQTATLAQGTLGYEWDWEQYPTSNAPGRFTMSSTPLDARVHKLSLYKSSGGGLVFGAGTVQWTWGLDANHDRNVAPWNQTSTDMQQATINLFADMGVQPATLQTGLLAATASTDVTAPATTITAPANGSSTTVSGPVTISGTSTDANVVAGVELSFDGGITWTAATGTTSWTYSWTPPANGVYTIKARGIDDSGNFTATASAPSITFTVNVGSSLNCPCNIFGATAPSVTAGRDNTTGIVIGTKFQSSVNGLVTGIRFYKASGNTGTHQGLLYNTAGTLLAQATFSGETATGWQTVSFSTPVNIVANTTYVAAYLSGSGFYSSTNNYFAAAIVNNPLTGLADGTDGSNGLYLYSATAAYPTNTYQKGNYWVDAVFNNIVTLTANAGTNQTITLPTSSVTLNGSASTGTITSYAWTKVSGPNTPAITTPAAVSTTVTGLIQGVYVFQLSINGGASTSQVTITVNPAPPPVANAGTNQTITLPVSTVTLNGSGSTGTITSYAWTNVSGPSVPAITTPATVSTTVTGLIQGTYIFKLSVNGGVSTSQVTVTVNPVAPPVANAGVNQTINLPATSCVLNGSASTGSISSYAWTRVSGPNTPTITSPAAVSTTVTGLIQGTYVFQLSLNGGVSVSQVTVSVVVPVATATIFTTQTPTGTPGLDAPVELGVKFRSTLNGFITGVRFYKTTGFTGTHIGELYSSTGTRLAQATFTGETASGWQTVNFTTPVAIVSGTTYVAAYYNAKGYYVADDNGLATAITNGNLTALANGTDGTNGVYNYSATTPIFPSSSFHSSNYWVDAIFSSNVTPTANAGTNQTISLPTSSVTLNGSGSTGSITSYTWTNVSGPNTPTITTPAAASTTVTGLIQGTYIFQLSVNGGVSTSQVTVTVNPAPPPVANAGTNQSITLPASSVTLNGSGSTGAISSYAWTLVSGPNTPTISTPSAVSTAVTGLIQGSYVFQLSLNGGVSVAQVTVTVNAVPPPVANAGVNQTISLPASSTTLNGSGSSGTITSYLWTFVSGPNSPAVATPTTVTTTVTGLVQGVYIFNLSLNGGVSSAQVTVTVSAFTTATIFTTQTPSTPVENDASAIELGVKFRSTIAGQIIGVRFYKSAGNNGTHTGELYSGTGTRLAQAVFTGETSTGWQQVLFNTPVNILANTTYVACYFSSAGNYTSTGNFFATAVVNNPLTALADGTDGVDGVFQYSSTPIFPTGTYQKENYWVDAIFSGVIPTVDTIPPTIAVSSPPAGATGVLTTEGINVFFSEPLTPSSVTGSSVFLQNGATAVPATVTYNSVENSAMLTPTSALSTGTTYTITVKGGTGTNKIKDVAGNAMAADSVWTFTTKVPVTLPNPANGPGGPILLISSGANPFSRYPVEILRAEGWNAFNALDISVITSTELNKYDAVIVGDIALTSAQVTLLTNWATAGGTLITFSPDPQLAGLLGITPTGGTLTDKYLLVNTSTGPGVGIVNQTMQYHGPADLYTVNTGTNVLATLYSDVSTATIYPAVTSRNVGTLGGQAIAFTYDLAKSVVYTRQGNPAWAGEKRDGQEPPIRSDDMFFGNASFDPQPDYVNLNKVAIPQADEQQRLMTNIIMAGSYNRKPLPRFWFLPKGKKAAIVMTGDDHGNGGTIGRMNQYISLSSTNTASDVANWNTIRSTSYIYSTTPITNAQIASFQNQGFEIGMHLNPDCGVWTPATLDNYFNTQFAAFNSAYYVAIPQVSHRIHCLSWSDWASLPKAEVARGMRFDVNYYYWPDTWISGKPGMFTGSGSPMRFADLDGSLIDCYQAPSQMTDESGQFYPAEVDALLSKATGPEGYYGVFTANMHTDLVLSQGSDAIINSAQNLQIPVVSGKQMLEWLDARNNSTFSNYTWNNNLLGFTVTQDPKALNLKGMLPSAIASGSLISLTQNGLTVNTTSETIKGISYVFFDAGNGNYVANYGGVAPSVKTPQTIHIIPTEDSASVEFSYYLGQNYPNPFYGNTRINYSIPAASEVELMLYDMQGRPVLVMVNTIKAAGNYEYDLNTSGVAKGMYFYRMHAGNYSAVKKLIIQ